MLISVGEILVDIFSDGSSKTVLPGGAPPGPRVVRRGVLGDGEEGSYGRGYR